MKVLVIDDSAFIRSEVKGLLESIADVAAVDTAIDGVEGFSKAVRLSPDVIMLDLEMPNMDGFTFLRLLRNVRKTSVIVLTGTSWQENARRAFSLGAYDFMEKPVQSQPNGLETIKKELERKLKLISFRRRPSPESDVPTVTAVSLGGPLTRTASGTPEAVVIGASTGGPGAVSTVVRMLPAGLPIAVCVSIHIPRWLTEPFVDRLNEESAVDVRVASDGEFVEMGRVLVAPGGSHMSFHKKNGKVRVVLSKKRADDLYAPSIDRMFSSAAEVWGRSLVGVVMTGMGSDGKHGVTDVKACGGFVIAESRESSRVFGMPGAAISTGNVDMVLSMNEIGAWLADRHSRKELKLA